MLLLLSAEEDIGGEFCEVSDTVSDCILLAEAMMKFMQEFIKIKSENKRLKESKVQRILD